VYKKAATALIKSSLKSFEGAESRMAKQEDLLALAERVKSVEEQIKGHDKEFKGPPRRLCRGLRRA
jgi:hypothetical protein